ncbi:uncharacterized protein PpBr36_06345 [Pyricularia pennisetigena]|uniref:uncharacterized protein n=1 Tax=Pyricularia pennisetigena TaxID=1578925 RepID=UPI00114E25E9|nr:uncharacterized protein PpBr36_06345 [Pyricularia pennisetigena]TLS22905.1 hypothetical protein PpBr36_06345 [Pyricularia pennisetigena]
MTLNMSKAATDIARRPALSHRRAASCYENMRVRSFYGNDNQLWTQGMPEVPTVNIAAQKQLEIQPEPTKIERCQDNYRVASKPLKAPQLTDVPCPRTLLRNSRGDKLELTEGMMSAYNILRGPQPVSRKDPLLSQMQADAGLFSFDGSEASSSSDSTLASSSGFSGFVHNFSSSFHTTIITPPDDADDRYSNLSDRTITCNIRRSPEKRAVLHQPFIEAKSREMKAEVVQDPWKCGPIDTSRYKLPPAEASKYETRNDMSCKVDLPSSMISPETFLAWSEGAQLWDTDILHQESRSREPEQPVRMRPSTPLQMPERGCPDDNPGSRSFHAYEEQYDQEDGERMSPHYKVPPNPSILWESRPVTPEMMYHCFPHGEFDRMDPVAGQACRDASLGFIPNFGVADVSPVAGEIFSDDEIDQVLNTHRGPIFDDITAAKYKEAISTLEEHLALSEQQEAQLEQQNEVQRQRLRSLELDLASLQPRSVGDGSGSSSGSPAVSETETCYSPVSAQRRARILRHMAARLRENLWQHNCRREAIAAARRENALLRLQVGQVEERLRAVAARGTAPWADQDQWDAGTPAGQDSSQWQWQ